MAHKSVQTPWAYACEPFRISDHVYYVGNTWVGSLLLDSGEGLILIDCGMPQTIYLIFEGIRKLGFDPAAIRKILITHAHYDHAGGAEAIRRYTGAKLWLGEEDIPFIGHPELLLADLIYCPDFGVDETYSDSEPVRLGRFEIRTLHTPGHTPGARSMFFTDTADGREVLCGMHGGIGFATMTDDFLARSGLPLSLQQDFYDGLKRLRQIPVTLAIGSHPGHLKMLEKLAAAPEGTNPFVDPGVWPAFMEDRMRAFAAQTPRVRTE